MPLSWALAFFHDGTWLVCQGNCQEVNPESWALLVSVIILMTRGSGQSNWSSVVLFHIPRESPLRTASVNFHSLIPSSMKGRKKKRHYSEHLWGARHKLELRDRERGVFILKEKDGQRDNERHVAARAGSEVRRDAKNPEEEASSSAQLVAIPVHTEGPCCCKF